MPQANESNNHRTQPTQEQQSSRHHTDGYRVGPASHCRVCNGSHDFFGWLVVGVRVRNQRKISSSLYSFRKLTLVLGLGPDNPGRNNLSGFRDNRSEQLAFFLGLGGDRDRQFTNLLDSQIITYPIS
jgi:hypothetical protein